MRTKDLVCRAIRQHRCGHPIRFTPEPEPHVPSPAPTCDFCGRSSHERHTVTGMNEDGSVSGSMRMCPHCTAGHAASCDQCGTLASLRQVSHSRHDPNNLVCRRCQPVTPPVQAAPEVEEEAEPEEGDTGYTCPECSDVHDTEEEGGVVRHNGTQACTSCSEQCPNCDEFVDNDDLVGINTPRRGQSWRTEESRWCESCADSHGFQCADCNDRYSNDTDSGDNANGDTVCSGCRENYFNCDACGNTYHNDDYGEEGCCQSCRDDQEEEDGKSDLIHNYSYDPPRWHKHGDPKDRHYGVELETVLKTGDLHDAAETTLDLLNHGVGDERFAYLKEDGSLDGGVGSFEIVTHPATLPFHRSQWQKFFADRPKALVSHDAPCSCGLHVHVDKTGLSDLAIYKMVTFVNSLSSRKFVEAIARRNERHYAPLDETKKAKDVKSPGSRYEAINLTNSHTVEFRLFKGTLNQDSFMRSLEFVDAVTEFGKNPSIGLQHVQGTKAFFEFVMHRAKDYPMLSKFVDNFSKVAAVKREAEFRTMHEPSLASAQLHRTEGTHHVSGNREETGGIRPGRGS